MLFRSIDVVVGFFILLIPFAVVIGIVGFYIISIKNGIAYYKSGSWRKRVHP